MQKIYFIFCIFLNITTRHVLPKSQSWAETLHFIGQTELNFEIKSTTMVPNLFLVSTFFLNRLINIIQLTQIHIIGMFYGTQQSKYYKPYAPNVNIASSQFHRVPIQQSWILYFNETGKYYFSKSPDAGHLYKMSYLLRFFFIVQIPYKPPINKVIQSTFANCIKFIPSFFFFIAKKQLRDCISWYKIRQYFRTLFSFSAIESVQLANITFYIRSAWDKLKQDFLVSTK